MGRNGVVNHRADARLQQPLLQRLPLLNLHDEKMPDRLGIDQYTGQNQSTAGKRTQVMTGNLTAPFIPTIKVP